MSTKKGNMTGFLVVMASVVILATLSVGVVLSLYFYNFHMTWGDQEKFAQFGDFLGGVLNPIFSLLTVALLIGSLYFQRRELGQVVVEMELTREVHTSSLNMHHYLYLLEESTKQTSDLNEAARTFRDTLDNDSITVDSIRERAYEVHNFNLFEVLSNQALFNQVSNEGFTVYMRDFYGDDKKETRTLSDHSEILHVAIKTMLHTVTLLKELGCPFWRAKDTLEIIDDVITDYYRNERCSGVYKVNLLTVAPKLEELIKEIDSYERKNST